jgi:hypothetical protein
MNQTAAYTGRGVPQFGNTECEISDVSLTSNKSGITIWHRKCIDDFAAVAIEGGQKWTWAILVWKGEGSVTGSAARYGRCLSCSRPSAVIL